jgi:predicted transcriptional regulator
MKDAPELEIRKRAYFLISHIPGLNLTTIAEQLHITSAHLDYHLRFLEKLGVIIVSREQGFKRYYAKDQLGVQERKILSLLRQQMLYDIIVFLLDHPYSPHKNIVEHFGLARSTISYYLKKLVTHGVIVEESLGEQYGYKVHDEEKVIGLLIRYQPSEVLEQFTDAWDLFHIE